MNVRCRITAAFLLTTALTSHQAIGKTPEGSSFKKKALYETSLLWTRFTNAVTSNRWWDKIDTYDLYLGAIPLKNKGHGEAIANLGVNRVLALLEPFEMVPGFLNTPMTNGDWSVLGVGQKQIHAEDFNPLTPAQFQEATAYLHAELSAGNRVYVHCKAGRGRSAAAVIAYLIEYKGLSFKEAYTAVAEHRPQINLNAKQRQGLYAYVRTLPGHDHEELSSYR